MYITFIIRNMCYILMFTKAKLIHSVSGVKRLEVVVIR